MKVLMLNTLDGMRRRGLGRLANHPTLLGDYNTAVNDPLQDAMRRLRLAANREGVPIADFDRLEAQYNTLSSRVVQHGEALEALANQSQLPGWLAMSEQLERDVDAFVTEVNAVLGYEQANRPLKLGLLTVGATVFVGGVVWGVWAYTQKKGPWKRRSRRR